MIYYVERHHPMYGVGKCGPFATREKAEEHLQSEDVKLDEEEGFWFRIVEGE